MAQKYVKPGAAAKTSATTPEQPVQLLYNKSNYTLLLASVVIVAIGFVLMTGTTDIYSTTKIVIAPIFVLAGFGLGFYALLKKPTN
jgi:type IV secretory pathway VirB2 component (pilin)